MISNTDQKIESGVASAAAAEGKWSRTHDAAPTDLHRELLPTQQLELTSGVIVDRTLQVSGVHAHQEANTRNSECHACEVFGVHAEFVINDLGDIVALPIGPGKPCPWG